MAKQPKTQVGTMACLCCGHEIPVKAAETGTLNAACSWCDFPAYAKVGTEAHRIIMGKLKPVAADIQAQYGPTHGTKNADPAPEPQPAPVKRASIFHGLGDA